MSDTYPEHLNPFAVDDKPKNKSTFRNSFKEFKKSLRQSFRIKKKNDEEVTLRPKTDTLRRLPLSYSVPQTEALPRSRFRERLSRCDQSPNSPGPNPFEEDENNKDANSTISRRRAKKRAPLPPKSFSSQNINDNNLQVANGASHWSLTSCDTDFSGSTDNPSQDDGHEEIKRESMLDKFMDFNKDMETLKDDSNNNVIIKEEADAEAQTNSNIPDLVISCPSDDSTKEETNKDLAKEETNKDLEKEETNKDLEKEESFKDLENENLDNSNGESTDLVVTDITDNMIEDKSEKEKLDGNDEDPKILFYEKTSLYIAGSRDELNDTDTYTGSVSLYITNSCDDLDVSNNNEVCNKTASDENSISDAVPTPKQRKNKLSKNMLLGM